MTLHVVALSGGKDSTAMALRLLEIEPRDYTYICTPTGDELPEMFAHWRSLSTRLGKSIIPIMGGTLTGLVEKQHALPNHRQRWCTRILKIQPYAAWLMEASKHQDVVSYVGLRADEAEREGGDYARIPGIVSRYPLRDWGWRLNDVWQYLEAQGVSIPKRTDCARCFFQRIGEWWALWRDYPEIYADAMAQEKAIGHTWRTPGRDSWPTNLADLKAAFDAGRTPLHASQRDLFAESQCRVCRL